MSIQPPQNPRAWVIQPRARTDGVPLMTAIGKHYGRAIHQTVPCTVILDTAKNCLELRHANQEIEDAHQNTIFREYYLPLRHRFGQALDNNLINDDDWSFRRKAASQFHKGRSQGRSDDLVCLRRVLPEHRLFRHLPVNHVPGFATDEYAALLRTPNLDLNNPEIRAALNAGLIDAPSNQLYAGVYAGYEFPNDNAHPFEGLFRSALFVDMYLGVFYGPRASKHLNPGSSGRRSKAFKNDMTRVTKASIAYIAMLLRFCLHQNEVWYTVESNLDTRYNYFILYTETLALLDEPTFKTQVDNLLAYLNRLIFPRTHGLPANPPSNTGPSALELALAQANALADAND